MGVTGSIGTQALDVLRAAGEAFTLVAVSAGRASDELMAIVRDFAVPRVGVATEHDAATLRAALPGVDVLAGPEGLDELSRDADVVINAVVGFAGLPVTLAALEAGTTLALANKESLIAAAPLVLAAQQRGGGVLVPVDSEHCAIHQCLASSTEVGHPDVRRLILTASGGPFRSHTAEQLAAVTRDEALRHPTWSMGPKITIDSSTLMNKGLEVLEASALFGVEVDRIDVVVHPQSVVHSMVEYVDGSVLAQLSQPDMRLPIAYCLGWPQRLPQGWGRLDFTQALSLDFSAPDREKFPALDLAYAAARRGGAAPAWLSAANEVAVAAFLADSISWSDIVAVVASTMDAYVDVQLDDVATLLEQDAKAREVAHGTLKA